MPTPSLEHPHLDRRVHLMRAPRRPMRPIRQPREPLTLIPAQPPMDCLTRHVEPASNLDHGNTVPDHRQHRLIPLLHHTQLHQHARSVTDQAEPPSTIRRNRVTQQPKPKRHASGGTKHKRGAPGEIRTPNLLIRSQMLYPLSYGRMAVRPRRHSIARRRDSRNPFVEVSASQCGSGGCGGLDRGRAGSAGARRTGLRGLGTLFVELQERRDVR